MRPSRTAKRACPAPCGAAYSPATRLMSAATRESCLRCAGPSAAKSGTAAISSGVTTYGDALPTRFASDVREHREHAPVIIRRRREAELSKDVRHMLFHRALGDDQLLGDRVIGPALGHQPQDLALARRQFAQRIPTALP